VVQVSTLETVLKRISVQGWAAVDQELEEGLRSVAVPIRDNKGQVVAAANISAHASRASMEDLQERFLPLLQSAVAHIEADLLQLPLQDTTRITGL
jgi:IclR family pca regulon transcriptional regulator